LSELNYNSLKINYFKTGDESIAIRKFGQTGDALVLVHGFAVHGYTWRKLLPELSKHNVCYVLDLPGFGDSQWSQKSDLSFTAQALRLQAFVESLNEKIIRVLAHDTGASIARMVAINAPDSISDLICINTEIPNHRPPYIQMHQFLAKLPLANSIFRLLLKIDYVVKSPLLLNQFYSDKKLLNQENLDPYLVPLRNSKHRMMGMLNYLIGIEWSIVDGFEQNHRKIKANTLFLWGEDDKTFPVRFIEPVISRFICRCKLIKIQGASLMPHEERPDQVVAAIAEFINAEN